MQFCAYQSPTQAGGGSGTLEMLTLLLGARRVQRVRVGGALTGSLGAVGCGLPRSWPARTSRRGRSARTTTGAFLWAYHSHPRNARSCCVGTPITLVPSELLQSEPRRYDDSDAVGTRTPQRDAEGLTESERDGSSGGPTQGDTLRWCQLHTGDHVDTTRWQWHLGDRCSRDAVGRRVI